MGNSSRFPNQFAVILRRGANGSIKRRTAVACCYLLALLMPPVLVRQVTAQEKEQTPTEQPIEGVKDSDGDGLPDATDKHPLIAEIQEVSWRVTPLKLGWKLDASIDLESLELTESDKELIKQRTYSFGGVANGNASLSTSSIGAGLSVAGKCSWDRASQSKATELRKLVENRQIAQHLNERNLEFTVNFFNHSDTDYIGDNLQIPIKADGSVVAIAQPIDANGPVPVIRLPAKRNRATPILFRAALDTTQSLDLLTTMEKASPEITIQETQGRIVAANPDEPNDAISYLTGIEESTWTITVELDGTESEWRIARKNPKTNAPTTFADAFEAINSLSLEYGGGSEAAPFEFRSDYVRSIYGRKNALFPFGWWRSSTRGKGEYGRDIDPKIDLEEDVRIHFEIPTQSKNASTNEDYLSGEVLRWIEIAENSDDPFPKFVAGSLLIDSEPKRALEFIQFAAGKDEPEAMFTLGAAHLKGGFELELNVGRAKSLLLKAADKGISAAFVLLGELEAASGDENAAVEFIRNAAALGEPEGLFLMGNIHATGLGEVPKNEKKAIELWEIAAERGHTKSFVFLGAVFFNGVGVDRDQVKGVEFWRKGHEVGDPESSFMLGKTYREGQGGLVKDNRKALELIQHAADNGLSSALLELSRAHLEGFGGLNIDERQALGYLKRAAQKGNVEAMVELADAYVDGDLGVGIDEKSAAFWFQRAAACGYDITGAAEKIIQRQSGKN